MKFFKKIALFIKECVAEVKKIIWPSKEDVIASTKVVVLSTIIMAILLGLIDFLLVSGIEVLFK